jgi:hypothetical protein
MGPGRESVLSDSPGPVSAAIPLGVLQRLNRTNLGFPESNVSDAAVGTTRTTFPARQIQLGLKLLGTSSFKNVLAERCTSAADL